MIRNNNQGLVRFNSTCNTSFITSIANKQRVYIAWKSNIIMNVIKYCKKYSELNFYISRNSYFASTIAFAFKLDFDHKLLLKINEM